MLFRRNWLFLILSCFALASAALATGCGGGDDLEVNPGGGATTAPAGGGDDSGDDGGTDGAAFEDTTFQINETFYHSGFEVELGEGNVDATTNIYGDIDGYYLTIEGTFKNLGDDQGSFYPEMSIVQGTKNYQSNLGGDTPTVGGGLTGEGELLFSIDDEFDYEQAKLIVGSGDETRAEVPFAPSAGELVALAPEEPVVTGKISVTQIDLDFTGAELRYDVPISFEEVDDGDRALTLNFTATSRRSGNWNVFAQEFALTKPNGNSVPADGAGLGSLPGSDDGIATEDLYVRFLVDAEATGSYTLRFKPATYWTEPGPEEATLTFELD